MSVDPALSYYTSIKHAVQNTLSCEQEIMNPSKSTDYHPPSVLYRVVGRDCLVYDMAGTHLEHWADDPSPGPSVQHQPDKNIASNQQITLKNTVNHYSSSQHTLSGIGLHMNGLAATPNDYLNDILAYRRLLIGPSSSTGFYHPCGQEMGIDNVENGVVRMEDSEFKVGEGVNPSSPEKKRRRFERGLEGEGACKRCHCKKSKCLKLYCECFAAGVYCLEPCACIDCFNKPIHQDTVLTTRKQIESRNPLAFAPKVIRGSDSVSEIGDDCSNTPACARHKRGCNCKKSGCLKKYCECYQSGVGCSINCRCERCKNAFGRKDGSVASNNSHEDETNTIEKPELNRSFRKTKIHDHIKKGMNSMPLTGGRQLAEVFATKKRSYISSLPSISSSTFSTSQSFGKSTSFLPLPGKFIHSSETLKEDEMPDILLEASPKSSIKSLSPNGKRVSSPQRVERSPGLRSSRKLILQSIPSFPSLANNQ